MTLAPAKRGCVNTLRQFFPVDLRHPHIGRHNANRIAVHDMERLVRRGGFHYWKA